MPNDITSLQQELNTPGAGTDSELYRAIAPLVDLERLPAPKSPYESKKIEKLKEDLRRGTVGLEYLTGLKNNKVETFQDRHPVQSVISDALNNSGTVGMGVALGVPTANALRQVKVFGKAVPSMDAREGDAIQRARHSLLSPTKDGTPLPTPPQVSRVFGDGSVIDNQVEVLGPDGKTRKVSSGVSNLEDIQRRMTRLEQAGLPTSFKAELNSIQTDPNLSEAAKTLKVRELLQKTEKTTAFKNLGNFAELHRVLKEKGKGVKKAPIGSGLGDKVLGSDAYQNLMDKYLATSGDPKSLGNRLKGTAKGLLTAAIPSSYDPTLDLARKQVGAGASPDILREVITDHHNLPEMPTDPKNRALERILEAYKNPAYNSRLGKAVKRFGLPAAAGIGITAGGAGLHHLLKAIQNKVYGDEQINEWKRNALKARGEFEEANRIK
jgi:hypothetical protein